MEEGKIKVPFCFASFYQATLGSKAPKKNRKEEILNQPEYVGILLYNDKSKIKNKTQASNIATGKDGGKIIENELTEELRDDVAEITERLQKIYVNDENCARINAFCLALFFGYDEKYVFDLPEETLDKMIAEFLETKDHLSFLVSMFQVLIDSEIKRKNDKKNKKSDVTSQTPLKYCDYIQDFREETDSIINDPTGTFKLFSKYSNDRNEEKQRFNNRIGTEKKPEDTLSGEDAVPEEVAEAPEATARRRLMDDYKNGLKAYYGIDTALDYNTAYDCFDRVTEKENEIENTDDCITYAKVLLARMNHFGLPKGKQSFENSYGIKEEIDKDKYIQLYVNDWILATMSGIGCKISFEEKEKFVEDYAEYMNDNSKFVVGRYYYRIGMYDKARTFLERINDDNPEANFLLGEIYYFYGSAENHTPDCYTASIYYEAASKKGFKEAYYRLGQIKLYGSPGNHDRGDRVFKRNPSQAKDYFKQGAEVGHAASQYAYALMCKSGIGIARDTNEALKYLRKSARNGHFLAMRELSILLGVFEALDTKQALCLAKEIFDWQGDAFDWKAESFYWAEKASEAGDGISLFLLGSYYLIGRGTPRNLEEAERKLRDASEKGVFEAETLLDEVLRQRERD